MVQLRVGIGQFEHCSEDGITWFRHLRQVPARHTPLVHGDIELRQLPVADNTYWDFVTVLPCGFGVAVGHQTMAGAKRLANLFVTTDRGRHWYERETMRWLSLQRNDAAPIERFASLAVYSPSVVAIAWEDPWLFDGPQSHVITSRDAGESWDYHCLGYTNPYLALNFSGRLSALNNGYYLENTDGGTIWAKRDFQIDWPEGYEQDRVALLREVTFTAPEVAYALVVHWAHKLPSERPPNVGLLTTTDGGKRWRHLHVFEGPNIGDINERHVLNLQVT